ncbi:MAG TPA: hypothetical protein VGD69_11410, partial [Herpetosiphonaceae bacterium]
MGSLRSMAVLASLLIALCAGAQATPSAATASVPAAADCAAEGAHCVFMPWMRVPAPPPMLQPLVSIPG